MSNRIIPYDQHLKKFARDLRKNPTPQEEVLWDHIRRKQIVGVEFHRQVPISHFIVDFYCHEIGLAIELDGRIHDYQIKEDMLRHSQLEALGVVIIRFSNDQIDYSLQTVVEKITSETRSLLKERSL